MLEIEEIDYWIGNPHNEITSGKVFLGEYRASEESKEDFS